MPSFNKTILKDALDKATVAFNYVTATTIGVSSLTGSIQPSELYSFQGATSPTAVSLGISRIYWSIPTTGTAHSIELAYGLSGSLTGQPIINLNNSGYFDLINSNSIRTSYTGTDRNNNITLRNSGVIPPNCGISVILELDKILGYKY